MHKTSQGSRKGADEHENAEDVCPIPDCSPLTCLTFGCLDLPDKAGNATKTFDTVCDIGKDQNMPYLVQDGKLSSSLRRTRVSVRF